MAKASKAKYSGPKPKNNAYTVLLAIALVAQIVGITFLTLDYMNMKEPKKAPNLPSLRADAPGQ
jgi:hypothetical protein